MSSSTKQKCPICDNVHIVKTNYKLRDDKSLDVLYCKDCSLLFLSSFEHIDNSFYQKGKMHSKSLSAKGWLKGTKEDDIRRYNFLKNKIKNKTLLDFGCGVGGFLLLARNIADVKGVEFDESYVDFYKQSNLNIQKEISNFNNEKFDFITMFHVLEHLKNPKEKIIELLSYLKDDGELIIEIPNIKDALIDIYKCKAFMDFTFWKCHLFNFNKKSLKILLKDEKGMKINYIKSVQRYGLANHWNWIINSEKAGHLKYKVPTLLDKIYKNIVKLLNKSDTLIISISKVK